VRIGRSPREENLAGLEDQGRKKIDRPSEDFLAKTAASRPLRVRVARRRMVLRGAVLVSIPRNQKETVIMTTTNRNRTEI
jgi:hypothetical protein